MILFAISGSPPDAAAAMRAAAALASILPSENGGLFSVLLITHLIVGHVFENFHSPFCDFTFLELFSVPLNQPNMINFWSAQRGKCYWIIARVLTSEPWKFLYRDQSQPFWAYSFKSFSQQCLRKWCSIEHLTRLCSLPGYFGSQEGVLGRYHSCFLALQDGEVTITGRQLLTQWPVLMWNDGKLYPW